MAYLTSAFSMDTDLWEEMELIRLKSKTGRSFFIQSAIRLKIAQEKKRNVKEFYDSLDEREIELLKNEIKKRS